MPQKLAHILFLSLVTLLWLLAPLTARAEEADELSRSLGLAADEPVTLSRFPRPASKVAEDVTVVTADDIARINAHTLSDVLQTVPGVQLDQVNTPGTFNSFTVLATTTRHVQLLIDGVPQNFLSSDNTADPGSIPVQMIDRVEIIKGTASAAWGSALGGVVNVITKAPDREEKLGGMVSASLGEASTTDTRAELTGTVRRIGYYVTGGKIHSQGLLPGNGTTLNHAFAKASYELPNRGNITLGVDVRESAPGDGSSAKYNLSGSGTVDNLSSHLAISYPLADRLTLQILAAGGRRKLTKQDATISGGMYLNAEGQEVFQDAKAAINWGDAEKNLTAGLEYEHVDISQSAWILFLPAPDPAFNFTATVDRWAAYLNGTYTVGRLSVLPGIRYDRTSTLESATSYTLGSTLRVTDNTILRAYTARGYSLPVFNNLNIRNGMRELQNVWTVQAGLETAEIPFLWIKGTYFYNNIWDIQTLHGVTGGPISITLEGQTRQGVEAEVRTSALYGVAVGAAYTYCDSRDKKTGQELFVDVGPREGWKIAVNYDNATLGTRATLFGNYFYMNNFPGIPSKTSAVIWDLHLTQKLFPSGDLSPEVFLSLHNIFNDDQYQLDLRPNTPRWIEGGLRFRF